MTITSPHFRYANCLEKARNWVISESLRYHKMTPKARSLL